MNMKRIFLAGILLVALGGEAVASQSTQRRRVSAKQRRIKGQGKKSARGNRRLSTTQRRGRGPQKPVQRAPELQRGPISPKNVELLDIVPIELTQSERDQLTDADLVNYQELTARQAELISAGSKTAELTAVQDSLKELKSGAADKLTLSKESSESVATEEEKMRKALEVEQETAFAALQAELANKPQSEKKPDQPEEKLKEEKPESFETARNALYSQIDEIEAGYNAIRQKYVAETEGYFKKLYDVIAALDLDKTSTVSEKLQKIRDVKQDFLAPLDKEFAVYKKENDETIKNLRKKQEPIVQMAEGGASDKNKLRNEIGSKFGGVERLKNSIADNLASFFVTVNNLAIMIYDTDSDLHKQLSQMNGMQNKITALSAGTIVDESSDPKRSDARSLVEALRKNVMNICDQLKLLAGHDLYTASASDSSVRKVINFFGNNFYNDTLVKPLNTFMDSVRDRGNQSGFFAETKTSPRPKLFPDFK